MAKIKVAYFNYKAIIIQIGYLSQKSMRMDKSRRLQKYQDKILLSLIYNNDFQILSINWHILNFC